MLRRLGFVAGFLMAGSLSTAAPPTPAPVPDLGVSAIGVEMAQEVLVGLCAGRQPERATELLTQLRQWREQHAEGLQRLRKLLGEISDRQRALADAGEVLRTGSEATDLMAARFHGAYLMSALLGPMPDAQVRERCGMLLERSLDPRSIDQAVAAAERFLARLPQPRGEALPTRWPDLVILVRHAEKSSEGGKDPALSEAGQRRARQLAEALADAGVQHIVSTEWRRTQETAAPLARQLNLRTQVLPRMPGVASGAQVASALRGVRGTALVVGHSNTVPEILAALGGPKLPWLCESSFGHILLWRPAERSLVRLRYGDADPAPPADCL